MTARFASRCLACLATVAWGVAPGAVAQDVSTPTSGDVLTDLGTLGGRVSSATAIDKAGQIAGSAETSEILGPHYERPVAVKRRYDPTNLFRQN